VAKSFSKLTRTRQRALGVADTISEHGITYTRLANGDGSYTVNVMIDGQRIHRVVGRESDGTTRTQAEDFIAKVRADAKNDRLALPKGRKLALSFRDASKTYIERLAQSGGLSIAKKTQQLHQHLEPFFGNMPLSKLTTFDVERYKKKRLEQPAVKSHVKNREKTFKQQGATAGTINRELAVVSHLFAKAMEWGWIDRRPAKIVRLKEGVGRIAYLTVEQVKVLIECAKMDESPHVYPFIVIGLGTSMRKTEILTIRKEHVDLERRIIHIPKAKAGSREQPITSTVSEFLRTHMVAIDSPWLFPSPGAKSGRVSDIRKAFRRVVIAAGMNADEVVRHTLRHTAITHLVQAGVDLPTIKRISGHKTLLMVERYAHQNGAHIGVAMQKLESRYAASEDRIADDGVALNPNSGVNPR
jgi:integrase